jgi:hypothetical protein
LIAAREYIGKFALAEELAQRLCLCSPFCREGRISADTVANVIFSLCMPDEKKIFNHISDKNVLNQQIKGN